MASWFEGKTILVPWDYSDLACEALKSAFATADDPSRVHVIHVTSILSASDPAVVWGTIDDETRRERLMEKFEEMLPEGMAPVKENFHVSFGDPGTEITQHAKEIGADVVMMPSHGRHGLERLLLGSVAERVARLAECPVLILK